VEPRYFNVKLLSKALQQQTSGIDGPQVWDEVAQFSHLTLRELQFWAHNTVEMATRRKPMILPRFEDLEIEWARLESGGVPDCSGSDYPLGGGLVTNGGPDGWGATLWLPGVQEPSRGAGKCRQADIASGKTKQQAWREGWSVILAVLAFALHMEGKATLHHSDCSCVVKALRDGSTGSDVLQEQALELWQLTSRFNILLLSGWVPGDRSLILEQTVCHAQKDRIGGGTG